MIVEFEANFERMACADPDHAVIRDMILRYGMDAPDQLHDEILYALGPYALENLHALRHVAISPCIRKPGNVETATLTLSEEFAKIEARLGLDAELAEAEEDLSGLADEAVTWRLGQAAEARNKAVRSENEDRAQYDIADNGARLNKDERNLLSALTDGINFTRKRS